MNTFNQQQHRLWKSMIDSIKLFMDNKISFQKLVSDLHGAMQAGDFNDTELIKKWYELWGRLEIHNAVSLDSGNLLTKEEVLNDVILLKDFLQKNL